MGVHNFFMGRIGFIIETGKGCIVLVKFSDLNCKEVICLSDGRRLGFISDARIELPEGKIVSIIVPGRSRFLGLFGCRDEYVIPWDCIRRMGPDIVLVDIRPEDCCMPRPRLGLHF